MSLHQVRLLLNCGLETDLTNIGCDVWDDIVSAAIYVNPCFNIYHLTDFCPFLWDEMGFPSLATVSENNLRNSVQIVLLDLIRTS